MAHKLQKTAKSAKQHGVKALNDTPPALLASAGFNDQTLRALEDNAQRARTTSARPMSKDDFEHLLDEAKDAA